MNNPDTGQRPEMIYGIHPVMEAIISGREMDKVMLQKGAKSEGYGELISLLKKGSIPYQFVPVEKLNRVTRKNHQGVVAFTSPVSFFRIEDILPGLFEAGKVPFLVVMDRITDVRNFGAILRSADAAGVDAILIPSRGSALLNAEAVKASAGAIYQVPLCRSDNLKDSLAFLKNSGLTVIASTEKAEKDFYLADLTVPLALLLGSEGDGVSVEYLKLSDDLVKIPMLGTIASLNVSVAAGIILYEVVRQRR